VPRRSHESRASLSNRVHRILPNYGEAHGNLANVLAWKQDFREASYEFGLALRLGPTDVSARLSYGAMLNSLRQFADAQVQMEAALRLNPRLAEAHDLCTSSPNT
jgi:Flp pilus assembly protein TadD